MINLSEPLPQDEMVIFMAHIELNYSKIVWVFQQNVPIPFFVNLGDGVSMEITINLSRLIMYDISGKCFSVLTGIETPEVIEGLRERSPNTLIGYNKKRAKLAKNDFVRGEKHNLVVFYDKHIK